jgi:hypothetical protein
MARAILEPALVAIGCRLFASDPLALESDEVEQLLAPDPHLTSSPSDGASREERVEPAGIHPRVHPG